jgi:hypothetical protein
MSGKYSAEWWKKFSSMNRERSDGQDRPNLLDLIQTEASARQVKVETAESQFSLADQQDTY